MVVCLLVDFGVQFEWMGGIGLKGMLLLTITSNGV